MPVISTNNAVNQALIYLNKSSAAETNLVAELASGSRIVNASSDPSGLAIGTQLTAYASIYSQDASNVSQGNSILQSADGALAQISNVLTQMLALATESASGQVTNTQRTQDLQTEYSQLQTEIGSIVNSTTYAGQALLTGSFLSNIKFLVGTNANNFLTVSVNSVSASTLLGSGSLGVSTSALALTSINSLTSALSTITTDRAKVGAYESQFNFSGQSITSNIVNTQAAASTILDADVAQVKAQLSTQDVQTQAAIAALAQAAQLPSELLKFIQS